MPPTCKTGRILIAITIIPMPPSHCNNDLHIKRPLVIASRSVIIVEPVVVTPDIDSNIESVSENSRSEM